MSNSWIKKNTNVFGSRTAMELKGVSCISLDIHLMKKEKIAVYQDRLEKKLQN